MQHGFKFLGTEDVYDKNLKAVVEYEDESYSEDEKNYLAIEHEKLMKVRAQTDAANKLNANESGIDSAGFSSRDNAPDSTD